MSKPALLSLQLVLKKCFQSLQNNQNMWNSVLHECTPLMVSLCNLAEQLRALQNINIANTTLHDFPDLQERLHYKLVQAVDIVLGKLSEKMSLLQPLRDSFSNQVSGAFQLYEQNSDSLDIAVCCHRSATAPSICDMLEWLQDAERYYRQQYGFMRRTVLLQLLTPNQVSLLETAAKRWASLDSPHGQDSIADTLFKVSFFVEAP